MQMRAGRAAGGADIGDDLTLGDATAGADATGKAVQVGIGGLIAIGVADADIIAETAIAVSAFDDAIAGGHDRGAARGSEVSAVMAARITQDRVTPGAREGGGEAGAIDRGQHQQALGAGAFGAVIADNPVLGLVAVEFLGVTASVIHGIEDVAGARSVALFVDKAFEQDVEIIARLD